MQNLIPEDVGEGRLGGNLRVVGDQRGKASVRLQELVLKYGDDTGSLKRGYGRQETVLAVRLVGGMGI